MITLVMYKLKCYECEWTRIVLILDNINVMYNYVRICRDTRVQRKITLYFIYSSCYTCSNIFNKSLFHFFNLAI